MQCHEVLVHAAHRFFLTACKFCKGIPTWRIIPVSKWLVTPFISHLGHLEGEQPYLGDLLTMVINHLQVLGWPSKHTPEI